MAETALTHAINSNGIDDIDFNSSKSYSDARKVKGCGIPLVYKRKFPKDTSKPILIKNYQKIKIRQDPKKGVTVASIALDDLDNEFRIPYHPKLREHRVIKDLEDSLWGQIFNVLGFGQDRFMAVTHCADTDEWDDMKGVQAAREKLSYKVYKAKLKAINMALMKIDMLKEPLEALKEDTEYKCNLIRNKRYNEMANAKSEEEMFDVVTKDFIRPKLLKWLNKWKEEAEQEIDELRKKDLTDKIEKSIMEEINKLK